MATYGDPFSTSLPVVGSSGPQYATDMNSILTDIMTRLASKVPLSSLLVTSDLSLGSYNLTNVSTVGLTNLAGTNAAGTAVPRIEAVNGDFYFVGPSGAVKVTSGANLNAAGLAGITGDYGGVNPAQFRYDSANTRYDAYANQTTGQWAYTRALGFDIAAGATSTVRARLNFAGSSNVVYTLPTAAPASQALLQMDNTGAVTANNTLASGQNINLVGTGKVTRGARQTTVPIIWGQATQFTGATGATHSTGDPGVGIPLGADVIFPIQLPDADQQLTTITSVVIDHTLSGTGTFNFNLYKGSLSGFTALPGASASGTGAILLTPTTPFTPAPTETLWVRFTNVSGTITGNVYTARINSTVS